MPNIIYSAFLLLLFCFFSFSSVLPAISIPVLGTPPQVRSDGIMVLRNRSAELLLFGGRNYYLDAIYNDVWSFSITSLRWNQLIISDPWKINQPRYCLTAVIYEFGVTETVFIFGGIGINGELFDAFSFSFRDMIYVKQQSCPSSLLNPRAVVFNQTSIIVLGRHIDAFQLWQVTIRNGGWTTQDWKQLRQNFANGSFDFLRAESWIYSMLTILPNSKKMFYVFPIFDGNKFSLLYTFNFEDSTWRQVLFFKNE